MASLVAALSGITRRTRHIAGIAGTARIARIASIALGLALTLAHPSSHAACDTGLAERMSAKLHPSRTLDHERAACKAWRGTPNRFIVVLPLLRPGAEPDAAEFDLDVMVVEQADNGNTERTSIVSRLFQTSALSEDAVRITEIRIDTGRYVLAKDSRAFGIRVLRQGPSRVAPYASETLDLYLPRGARLAKVLDGQEILLEHGEWDSNCTGVFETVRGSLSLLGQSSNGLADLALRRSRLEKRSTPVGDQCQTTDRPLRSSQVLLRFDGLRYRASGSAE
ncbi:conserved hypothetical protein [Burkholderiales bacterium 8X]|nr:conserved hypothetical protein [Burkholderiales bacterium 8X]